MENILFFSISNRLYIILLTVYRDGGPPVYNGDCRSSMTHQEYNCKGTLFSCLNCAVVRIGF